MAVYRHIHIDYWQDGFVLDLTPEEKYFYIYLMTNSKTSQCGIYELPKRIIETETGYNRETVEKLLLRFEEYGKIVYCDKSKEIFLKNWIKHNKVISPKVKKCVEKELLYIKSRELIDLFLKECDKYGYHIDLPSTNIVTTMDTHVTDEDTTMDSVCIPIAKVDNNFEYGYGEKEKQKQKEKEKQKEKTSFGSDYNSNNFEKMRYLYESKIGSIDLDVDKSLFDIYEKVDIHLFERAIDISIERNKPGIAYIKGIIRKWNENGITTLESLRLFEAERSLRGDRENEQRGAYRKSKCTKGYEDENDEVIYTEPSKEQLDEVRRIMQISDGKE